MTYIILLKTAADGNLHVLHAEQLLQIDLHLGEQRCGEGRSSSELSGSFRFVFVSFRVVNLFKEEINLNQLFVTETTEERDMKK